MSAVPDILDTLVREAREETAERKRRLPLEVLEREVEDAGSLQVRDLGAALRQDRLTLIAEMKARTPSMGVLRGEGYDPASIARQYTLAGAAAVSVLTHAQGFGGSLEDLGQARRATFLPLLRKDFITDEYQVVEARALGADAVLLIAAVLPHRPLAELIGVARSWGMEALVETHDEAEVERAVDAGARVIGINNRDLTTFDVDLATTERLRPHIPEEVVVVAESGVRTREDARRMREAGADAILVGEALMRAADVRSAVVELIG